MGNSICSRTQTEEDQKKQITCDHSEVEETPEEEGPVDKYRKLLTKSKAAKFFPTCCSLLTLPSMTNSEMTVVSLLDINHKDYFKKQTECISTSSIDEQNEYSENQFFDDSFNDNQSSSIDLCPDSYAYTPIKLKLENYVKCKKLDINNAYETIKIIGKGKRGKVFLAKHKITNKFRAIKSTQVNQEVVLKKTMKFSKQVQVLSTLDHPNLIRLYEVYTNKNKQFIVTDYCQGGTLLNVKSHILQKYDQETLTAVFRHIVKEALIGISYLHSKNIVHRNIRMKKIMLLYKEIIPIEKNVVKIIDFSFAKYGSENLKKTNKRPTEVGQYAAPEQLKFNCFCSKTDIWQIGILLFNLFSDQKPFKRKRSQDNGKIIVTFIKNENAWSSLPEELNSLLSGMLEEDHQKRFSAVECLNHEWIKSDEEDFRFIGQSHVTQITQNKRKNNRKKTNLYQYVETLSAFKNIEADELKNITEVFRSLDKDYSGSVQLEQIVKVLQSKPKNFCGSEEILTQAISILKNMDTDGSGEIDYHEFVIGLSRRDYVSEKSNIEDIFEHFDLDNDGVIDQKQFLSELDGISPHQYQYYLNKMGITNGKMSKQKFIQYLLAENEKHKKEISDK